MESANILYVEDEESLALIVKESMESRGFKVVYCHNAEEALKILPSFTPDICVLDIMMPGMDGYSLAKKILKNEGEIPIIFLTAKSQTSDVVKGFELGAYDYIKKPFSIEELLVRIKSVLRRNDFGLNAQERHSLIELGKYIFDIDNQLLSYDDKDRQLTWRETEILRMLYENKNNILKRNDVLMLLWGDNNFFNARSMDVFITKLRKYLSHDPSISIINVRGIGYKLVV